MKVALAQTCPISAPPGAYSSSAPLEDVLASTKQNLDNVQKCVEEAKAAGAHVVCFPEYFLQGILDQGRQYLSLLSQDLESTIAALASQNCIAIVGTIVHGSSSRLPPPPTKPPVLPAHGFACSVKPGQREWAEYLAEHEALLADDSHFTLINEAFFVDSTGLKTGSYTKKNLWHPEREYLKPGTVEEPVFCTRGIKAGFLICWDLSHPAAAQRLADQGVDIIFAPTYWLATDSEPILSRHNTNPDYELNLVQSLCQARSFETETVLIHTNAGGSREAGFMGGSGVWAPLMGKIGGYDGATEGLRIVEVDMEVLKDARELYKIREDAAIRNGS